ncbi:MAG: methyltransferase domain-containing protein [Nostocales cyanobacterium 94392]|nr:methyltransferase domain-containing protein [Nostocales cyanobacterium 94392]
MKSKIDSNYLDKSYLQFESYPYPDIPIEDSPNANLKLLYESSFITAYYHRNKKVITNLDQRLMLDVACGSGFTTLAMAIANPGAQIIGIDISPKSLQIAEKRLGYHGVKNVKFHAIALENITDLGCQFDYINANDILYLLPDLNFALEQLKKVLKPEGIIQGNLHSQYQRVDYYRAQTLFQEMGLMEDNPEENELQIVRDFYASLKDDVDLKMRTWGFSQHQKVSNQRILMNHLFHNDKGYTLKQLFESIEEVGLEFIDMVDWREWDWRKLFKDPDNLPLYLAMGLESAELETQLRFYELIQPTKRLLDFWCGHPQNEFELSETDSDWLDAGPTDVTIHLHSCLMSSVFKQALKDGSLTPINLGDFFRFLIKDAWISRSLAHVLFVPLFDSPRSLSFFIDRWLQVRPINPVTLCPLNYSEAKEIITTAVVEQEKLGILMVD